MCDPLTKEVPGTGSWIRLEIDMVKRITNEQMRVIHVYPSDDNFTHHNGILDLDDDDRICSSCQCDPDHESHNGNLLVSHQRIVHN